MLELKNVTFGVEDADSTKEIIRGVSFVVPDEQFVVITGPNGGGKSTLARLIMGIEKPSSGQILLDGQDITALGITERARLGISFALQQPVRFKGIQVVDLLRLAARRLRVPLRGRPLRARLHQPRGQRQPLRRRDEAHRDRHRPGPRHHALRL